MQIEPLVQIRDLVKHFPVKGSMLRREKNVVHALDGVSLDIQPGEVLGIAGESGCGKTTLGRCLLQLIRPTNGEVIFDGVDLVKLNKEELRQLRPQMQLVFQNPLASLSPRMRIKAVLEEPLRTHKIPNAEADAIIGELLTQVGLGIQHLDRFPHELSGGQCQRVAIARALSLQPKLLVLDEPTSALDVSVQAQIINLLNRLREEHQLTYLFISHDLGVVEHLSDRIGVMYLGKLVELGPTRKIFRAPKHPYSRALLNAIPRLKPSERRDVQPLEGAVPSPLQPPSGCRFHTRCPIVEEICRHEEPAFRKLESGHFVACHFADEED